MAGSLLDQRCNSVSITAQKIRQTQNKNSASSFRISDWLQVSGPMNASLQLFQTRTPRRCGFSTHSRAAECVLSAQARKLFHRNLNKQFDDGAQA